MTKMLETARNFLSRGERLAGFKLNYSMREAKSLAILFKYNADLYCLQEFRNIRHDGKQVWQGHKQMNAPFNDWSFFIYVICELPLV